jgi:hypothetical protein
VCNLLLVVAPSPWELCDLLGIGSHQKLRGFVAKLTWAKQMTPSFSLGCSQAHLGKRPRREGQAASDCRNDEGPLTHASKSYAACGQPP